MSYCVYCLSLPKENIHRVYHDTEYGRNEYDNNKLFEKFCLEINQAGLSWDIVLKKRKTLSIAFDQWSIDKVAAYDQKKIKELTLNTGVIRHRKKIESIVYNANQILLMHKNGISFSNWLESLKGKSLDECLIIFKKKFKFVGTEIVKEYLQAINIMEGAHDKNCKIK